MKLSYLDESLDFPYASLCYNPQRQRMSSCEVLLALYRYQVNKIRSISAKIFTVNNFTANI